MKNVTRILKLSTLLILLSCATTKPLTVDEIYQIFSEKTVIYPWDKSKEYLKLDGTTVWDEKEGLVLGKWYAQEGKICFKYKHIMNEELCKEVEKKDDEILLSGEAVIFITGDSEGLQDRYEKKVEKEKIIAEEERERVKKEKSLKEKREALKEKREAKKRKRLAKKAKKLVGKRVKWTGYKNIDSDDCIRVLWQQICHSVKYRFRYVGTVTSVNSDKGQYIVKLSSVKLISQKLVAPMYWTYKERAQNWAAQQKENSRGVYFKHVSRY